MTNQEAMKKKADQPLDLQRPDEDMFGMELPNEGEVKFEVTLVDGEMQVTNPDGTPLSEEQMEVFEEAIALSPTKEESIIDEDDPEDFGDADAMAPLLTKRRDIRKRIIANIKKADFKELYDLYIDPVESLRKVREAFPHAKITENDHGFTVNVTLTDEQLQQLRDDKTAINTN